MLIPWNCKLENREWILNHTRLVIYESNSAKRSILAYILMSNTSQNFLILIKESKHEEEYNKYYNEIY
jgi:hypothetical protein